MRNGMARPEDLSIGTATPSIDSGDGCPGALFGGSAIQLDSVWPGCRGEIRLAFGLSQSRKSPVFLASLLDGVSVGIEDIGCGRRRSCRVLVHDDSDDASARRPCNHGHGDHGLLYGGRLPIGFDGRTAGAEVRDL